MKHKAGLIVTALCALAAVSNAFAQEGGRAPPTPEEQAQQATELRQSLLKVVSWSWAPTAGMLRTRQFDVAVVQKSAERVAHLSELLTDAFKTDTSKFSVKTRARPAVWASSGEFNTRADELTRAANALVAAAQSGNQAEIQKAAAAVGQACGKCHDSFREKQGS